MHAVAADRGAHRGIGPLFIFARADGPAPGKGRALAGLVRSAGTDISPSRSARYRSPFLTFAPDGQPASMMGTVPAAFSHAVLNHNVVRIGRRTAFTEGC